eukprot:6964102-Prymnesium_polylepis.2
MIGHCGHAFFDSKEAGSASSGPSDHDTPVGDADPERVLRTASVFTGSRAAFSRGSPPRTPAPYVSSAR